MKSPQKRYAIVKCPRCSSLQLVRPAVKSHRCSYCDRIIRLNSSEIRTICFASTPREASRTIMRLKSRGKP